MDDTSPIAADICRLCLEKGKSMQPIFQIDQLSLVKLMDILQVEAHEEDGLPTQMCHQCAFKLDAAYIFKKRCRENYEKLMSILTKAKVTDSKASKSLEDTSSVSKENFGSMNAIPLVKKSDKEGDLSESDGERDRNSEDNPSVTMPVVCLYQDDDKESVKLKIKAKTKGNGIKTHLCTICNKSFKLSIQLKKHFRSHTENKNKCLVCVEIFLNQAQLKAHLRTHISDPVQCGHCDKVFLNKSCMEGHMKTHSPTIIDGFNMKPFKCDNCEKSFLKQSHLVEHIRCHTGDRPFKCLKCKKSFTTNGNLQRHCRIHKWVYK